MKFSIRDFVSKCDLSCSSSFLVQRQSLTIRRPHSELVVVGIRKWSELEDVLIDVEVNMKNKLLTHVKDKVD